MLGGGDVTFCSAKGCETVASGLYYPNGLMLHSDGRLLVQSIAKGNIRVYQPQTNGSIVYVGSIDAPCPIDNLSKDANGDIWAAMFSSSCGHRAVRYGSIRRQSASVGSAPYSEDRTMAGTDGRRYRRTETEKFFRLRQRLCMMLIQGGCF